MRHAFFATSALIGGALIALAPPAVAQNSVEGRVDRLEKEMRAVQRKVFPAGTPIEAEITRPATPLPSPGTPASTPIADLTARVNALESQLASITGQVEENSYKLRQLEESFTKYKAEADARMAPAVAPPAMAPTASASPSALRRRRIVRPLSLMSSTTSSRSPASVRWRSASSSASACASIPCLSDCSVAGVNRLSRTDLNLG